MNSNPQVQSATPTQAFKVAAGDSRGEATLYVVGDELQVKISSRDTNGAFAVIEDRCPPQGGPPLHVHFEQDEWWYILEGDFLFQVDGKQFHAGPGDTVFAPRGTKHSFKNVGTSLGHTVVTVVPGGLDEFFEEVSATIPKDAPPDLAVIAQLFLKHGMKMLGPPIEPAERAA
jgi:mannose-6-phosphate isomerase-like protein (cupin superfamily)